ncbi:MAG: hypothetical protein GYA61_08505 [Spirochaetales bacterium]|jgi:predicted type IV restriction endonuclease|nr:hypothetical protein [Spirochaetales bacterium]
MERWVLVTKDLVCWKCLAEKKEVEIKVKNEKGHKIKSNDKVLIYRSGNHRDIKYLFEVISFEPFYGKYKLVLEKMEVFDSSLKLSEMNEDPTIAKWRRKFIKGFYNIPFRPWNRIIGIISKKNPELFEKHTPKCCSGPDSNGFPLNYKQSLLDFIKAVKKYKNKGFNEEATKQLIIIPMLQKLGWNTYDVCEVHPEYTIHHKSKRVDYVLKDYYSKQVCIEAKNVGEKDLDKHVKQLIEYCAFRSVDMGILTNGLIWRFYRIPYHSQYLGAIKMPKMVEIDLTKDKEEEIYKTFIQYLWKGNESKIEKTPIEQPSLKEIFKIIKALDINEQSKYNEEAMKQGIVLPFLNNMGWDTTKLSEVKFEKSIFIPKRSKREKVDYILGKGHHKLIVEVKGLNTYFSNSNTLDEDHFLNYMNRKL